jgi:outer membrane receptor protein involved in Fe transport
MPIGYACRKYWKESFLAQPQKFTALLQRPPSIKGPLIKAWENYMLNGMTLRLCLVALACSTASAGYAFADESKEISQPAGDLATSTQPLRLAQGNDTTRAHAPPAKTSDQGAEFAEIIVTATKRAENIQDIPLPVSVETSAQLLEAGYTNLLDYATNVPGLNVGSLGTPGQTQVSIRGISSTSAVSAIAARR